MEGDVLASSPTRHTTPPGFPVCHVTNVCAVSPLSHPPAPSLSHSLSLSLHPPLSFSSLSPSHKKTEVPHTTRESERGPKKYPKKDNKKKEEEEEERQRDAGAAPPPPPYPKDKDSPIHFLEHAKQNQKRGKKNAKRNVKGSTPTPSSSSATVPAHAPSYVVVRFCHLPTLKRPA